MYRGWLCNRCNGQISNDKVRQFGWYDGIGNKVPELIAVAQSYLDKHFSICNKPSFPVKRVRQDSKYRSRMQYWKDKCDRLYIFIKEAKLEEVYLKRQRP